VVMARRWKHKPLRALKGVLREGRGPAMVLGVRSRGRWPLSLVYCALAASERLGRELLALSVSCQRAWRLEWRALETTTLPLAGQEGNKVGVFM
jgi:hypothetical protein